MKSLSIEQKSACFGGELNGLYLVLTKSAEQPDEGISVDYREPEPVHCYNLTTQEQIAVGLQSGNIYVARNGSDFELYKKPIFGAAYLFYSLPVAFLGIWAVESFFL
ncbi:MAG: hypothetical protein FJ161_03810 [Gammaproteobacteria bacterium]|nr:hypothetical protein [Gammaproteobacteria bacterium]